MPDRALGQTLNFAGLLNQIMQGMGQQSNQGMVNAMAATGLSNPMDLIAQQNSLNSARGNGDVTFDNNYTMTPHGAAMPGGEYGGTMTADGGATVPNGMPDADPGTPVPSGPDFSGIQGALAKLGPLLGLAPGGSQAPPDAGPQVGNQAQAGFGGPNQPSVSSYETGQVDPAEAEQDNLDAIFHQYVDLAKGVTPERLDAEARARLHQKGYDEFHPGQDHGFHKAIRRILAGIQGFNDALQDPKGRYADGSKHDIMSAIHRSDIGADKQEEYDAQLEAEKKKVLAEKIGQLTIAKGVLDETQQNVNNSSIQRKRIADIQSAEEKNRQGEQKVALGESKLKLQAQVAADQKAAKSEAQAALNDYRKERIAVAQETNRINAKKSKGASSYKEYESEMDSYGAELDAAVNELDAAYEAKKQAITNEDFTGMKAADTEIDSAKAKINAIKGKKPTRHADSGGGQDFSKTGFTRGSGTKTVQKKPNSPYASGVNAVQ